MAHLIQFARLMCFSTVLRLMIWLQNIRRLSNPKDYFAVGGGGIYFFILYLEKTLYMNIIFNIMNMIPSFYISMFLG